jgi:hypothetical protein
MNQTLEEAPETGRGKETDPYPTPRVLSFGLASQGGENDLNDHSVSPASQALPLPRRPH